MVSFFLTPLLASKLGEHSNYDYATMDVENLTPGLRAMESGRAAALTASQEMLGYDSNPSMKLEGSLDDEAISVDNLPISEGDRFDVRLSRQNERQLESAHSASRREAECSLPRL